MLLALGRHFAFNAKPRIMQQKISEINYFLASQANNVCAWPQSRATSRADTLKESNNPSLLVALHFAGFVWPG
ncbi:MAG: hypothetical protein RLZZ371_1981 [Pseudomonadota bacterium]|jgi:hypothetical protein